MYKTRNKGTGNGMRATRGMGAMLYSEKCHQTFRRMSQKIPGNVAKYSGKCRDKAMYKTRNTGTGNGMRGMLYSGECRKTFRGMSSNIPGDILKHSGECHKRFRGMSPNIPGKVAIRLCIKPGIQERGTECRQLFRGMYSDILGNVTKHFGECLQIFRGISSNIPGNVIKHSGECRQTFQGMLATFGVKEDNHLTGLHLEFCQTSTMELFCENSQRP